MPTFGILGAPEFQVPTLGIRSVPTPWNPFGARNSRCPESLASTTRTQGSRNTWCLLVETQVPEVLAPKGVTLSLRNSRCPESVRCPRGNPLLIFRGNPHLTESVRCPGIRSVPTFGIRSVPRNSRCPLWEAVRCPLYGNPGARNSRCPESSAPAFGILGARNPRCPPVETQMPGSLGTRGGVTLSLLGLYRSFDPTVSP